LPFFVPWDKLVAKGVEFVAVRVAESKIFNIPVKALKLLQEGTGIGAKELEEGLKLAQSQEAADNIITKFLERNGLADRVGEWVVEDTTGRSARAIAYEEQITGRAGQAYAVKGVSFDGFARGILQEAKGPGYETFVEDGVFKKFFEGADDIVKQARRQVAAAQGKPIRWYIAEAGAIPAFKDLLEKNGIAGIEFVHVEAIVK
jgi:hypothetical protein